MRKNANRLELAGSNFTEDDQDRIVDTVTKMANMGREAVKTAAKAKSKAKSVYQQPQRVPTFNMIADLENALVAGVGQSFSPWLPEPLEWDADLADDSEKVADIAVINIDECILNLAMENFFKHHMGASMWFRHGRFHRRSNDMMRAIALSRLMGAAQKAIVWLAVTHGAWVQASFLRAFRETAADVPKIYGPNSKPVLLFWPWVCDDRGWTADDEVDEAGWTEPIKSNRDQPN